MTILKADLCIKTIHLDFEDRMHVTVTNLFPDVVIRSCRFHLGQAWWRTIQALGLAKEYKKNVTDISKWLSHFFGLALQTEDQWNVMTILKAMYRI
jgi:hypothetical protein